MPKTIARSITVPIRGPLTWQETWEGADKGLIYCWESGRKLAVNDPSLAERALRNELPPMPWKGGVEKASKVGKKIGSMNYLALWQGLRNEDLNVDLESELIIVCSRTGEEVTFTTDLKKLAKLKPSRS